VVLEDTARRAKENDKVVDAEGIFVGKSIFDQMAHEAVEEIDAHHKREPLERGLLRETLREKRFAHAAPEIFRALVSHLESAGRVVSEKEFVRAASHNLTLTASDAALRSALEKVYRDAALEAPTFDEALARAGGTNNSREHTRKILQLLIDDCLLVRVSPDLFFHRVALDNLVASLREYASQHEPERMIDVPTFKKIAGISRKYAIPLLEYFDRELITRRAGDKRIIL